MTHGAGSARSDVRVWRLVAAAIGCIVGAEAGLEVGWPAVRLGALAGLASAGAAAVLTRRHGAGCGRRRTFLIWLTWFLVGAGLAALSAGWHQHRLRDPTLRSLAAGRASVQGWLRVARDPVPVTTATGGRMWLVDVSVDAVSTTGGVRHVGKPALVMAFERSWAGLSPGQLVDADVTVRRPRPGDHVAAVLDAAGPPRLIGRPPWWQRAASAVRRDLARACGRLPPAERALVPALVLGVVTPLPADLTAQFRTTGLSHLIAVSGENLAILFVAVAVLVRRLGLPRWMRGGVLAATIVAFVVVARPSASVLRAAVMGSVAVLALLTGRHRRPLPALSLAVITLLLADPFLVDDLGFQLSVAATAGLVLGVGPLQRWLRRWLPRRAALAVAVPLAAQLACTPLLLGAFGRLTPYAVPANLVAGIAVAPATLVGVAAAATAWLCPAVAATLALVAAAPAAWIVETARTFASLPGSNAAASATGLGGVVVVLALGSMFAAAGRLRRPRRSARAMLPP